jgi:hypothetical protein
MRTENFAPFVFDFRAQKQAARLQREPGLLHQTKKDRISREARNHGSGRGDVVGCNPLGFAVVAYGQTTCTLS